MKERGILTVLVAVAGLIVTLQIRNCCPTFYIFIYLYIYFCFCFCFFFGKNKWKCLLMRRDMHAPRAWIWAVSRMSPRWRSSKSLCVWVWVCVWVCVGVCGCASLSKSMHAYIKK
jgi:hypothetical protein